MSSNPPPSSFLPRSPRLLRSASRTMSPTLPCQTCFCGSARPGRSAGCSVINGEEGKLEFRSVTSRTSDSPKRERAIKHQNQIKDGIDPRATEREIAGRSPGRKPVARPVPASSEAASPKALAPCNSGRRPLCLPYWKERDARTISSREIIERLDAITARELIRNWLKQ
jgi:hypothetical protein